MILFQIKSHKEGVNVLRHTTHTHFINKTIFFVLTFLFFSLFYSPVSADASSETVNALYFPAHKITARKASELIHYAAHTPVNAAVFHVKDPFGRLFWHSRNPMAIKAKVVNPKPNIHKVVNRLKNNHIRVIAKVDIFADHGLATTFPELAITHQQTGSPWIDKNGLGWANPFNEEVWAYNISLCRELAAIGFDEIQFDYIRFPSDGDLKALQYRNRPPGWNRSIAISRFLEKASTELRPLGVELSIDIFGLTAWKKDDFGVGQVLEKMAPHVDVICPMFYPSHFPSGFLGKKKPGEFPGLIMKSSMEMIKKRTHKKVRPWIQAFWYSPSQINDQLEAVARTDHNGWSMWNASGNYKPVYEAIEQALGTKVPDPVLYASLSDMRSRSHKVVRGYSRVVNYTDYKNGFSILSLETFKKGSGTSFSTPLNVLGSMDEAIMDQILTGRNIRFSKMTGKYTKQILLSELLCKDLGLPAGKLRPRPIHIDWDDNCRFTTRAIPLGRIYDYAKASKPKTPDKAPLFAGVGNQMVKNTLALPLIRPVPEMERLFKVQLQLPETLQIN